MTTNQNYHEGHPIFRLAVGGGTLVLCPYGHLYHHIHAGEWPGSMWEAEAQDPSYTVKCCGAITR